MRQIKFTLVGISIIYASFAWAATSYAGMMGGMHNGSNDHHGGYGDYDDHHGGNGGYGDHHGGGYDDHNGDGAVHGGGYGDHRGDSSRDERLGDAGAGHGPDHGDAIEAAPAPADNGQPRQGP